VVLREGRVCTTAEGRERMLALRRPRGALDLDWLSTFQVPGMDQDAADGVHLADVGGLACTADSSGRSRACEQDL
jgi:hypothetical protein